MKGVLIGAMSTMGLALVVLLAFLWVWLLSKKERAAKKYTEVRKQTHKDASKLDIFHQLVILFPFSMSNTVPNFL